MKKKSQFIYIFVLVLFCPLIVYAESPEDNDVETGYSATLDSSRQAIAEQLFGVTDYLDAAFDDVRSEEQREDDWFRLGTEVKFRTTTAVKLKQRFRAAINLRPFNDKLQLIIDSINTDDVESGRLEEGTIARTDSLRRLKGDSGFVGLRYPLIGDKQWVIQAEAGFRFNAGVFPLAGFRGATRVSFSENFSWDPTQFVFWDGDEGYGERTRSDLNYKLSDQSFLRSRIEALWAERSSGVELSKEFSYFKEIAKEQFIGATAGMFAYTKPSWTVDAYQLSVRYRFLLWSNWLYAGIEPGLEFPDDRDYRRTPFIAFRLDALIDRQSRLHQE